MSEIVEQAAYNNALWCDAVCATHQGAGEFHRDLWINRFGAPRYYPDVVTLVGGDAAAGQVRAISELVRSAPGRSWAVKDSFRSLDLYDLGFTPLFDAEWISATTAAPENRTPAGNLQWRLVDDAASLANWEQSWSEAPTVSQPPMFKPQLLSMPDIRFVLASEEGAVVGGGALNRGAGVIGISNVFAVDVDLGPIWEGLARCARMAFPGLPIVAYEHREERLGTAYRAGFSAAGPLRVWHIAPTEPR